MESHPQALRGGEHGALLVPGDPDHSRLIQVLEKRIEPAMPPKGNPGPSTAEIALLKAWIRAGARGPVHSMAAATALVTPRIEPVEKPRKPITSVAYSPDGRMMAVAGYHAVEILRATDRKPIATLDGHAGNVNDVGFSADGRLLFAAAGEPGLSGEVTLWNTGDWSRRLTLRGHRDALLAADITADGKLLATGSYDQTIRLWDVAAGKEARVLKGHNGPVFDLAFQPGGRLLASASGDRTVKLWDVATGERLDTFNQPIKEQYAVVFSPDGRRVIAGGVDSRIRVWRLSATAREGTNELVESLFAHDGPILRLVMSRDGRRIVSSSEDRTIKVWDAVHFVQLAIFANQPDWTTALAVSPDDRTLLAGRSDGSLLTQPLGHELTTVVSPPPQLDYAALPVAAAMPMHAAMALTEKEPNDGPQQATRLDAPAKVDGVIGAGRAGRPDVDYYRFHAKAGDAWILETEGARKQSPIDTRIDVLHTDGSPVVRCLLRAIRDSAITFRPIDSRQTEPRLENWQEMDLNQFLYMSGEVGRLFRAPQGPDSGFALYSSNGSRRCYFGTSAVSHALNEPVYIVEPYPPGTRLADNGLPVFPVFYSNDDDSRRKLGADSHLSFNAPAEGDYLVRVSDVRGSGGPNYKYSLTIRQPKPDFNASVKLERHGIPAGGGHGFTVSLDRIDNFEDEVRIEIEGIPRGYHATSPLIVEKGLLAASGTLNADPTAKPVPEDVWKSVKLTATVTIGGRKIVKTLGGFGTVELEPAPKFVLRFHPDQPADDTANGTADHTASPAGGGTGTAATGEIAIEPGGSVTAMLRVERHGYDGEMRVDVENLPHGVIVDNLGLNKIMIRAGENERQISMTATKWVRPTRRLIYASTDVAGGQTSLPIELQITGKAP